MKLDPECSGRNSEEHQISNFNIIFPIMQSIKNILTTKKT